MKIREIILESGTKILLGKDAESNDELVKQFKGKENVILHTIAPGSPFCVIDKLEPSKEEINASGAYCARFSQDWRDNQQDVAIHQFTGKEVKKPILAKKGTWKITNTPKVIKIKRKDIQKILKKV